MHNMVGGGGGKSQDTSENHKNIGFLSTTGRDTLKSHKATELAFNVGPFKWRFTVVPLMARFLCYLALVRTILVLFQN